jgi:hypothetical protein
MKLHLWLTLLLLLQSASCSFVLEAGVERAVPTREALPPANAAARLTGCAPVHISEGHPLAA